jgi:uncharacterized protein YraI
MRGGRALTESASKTLLHAMKMKLPLAFLVFLLSLPASSAIAAGAGAVANQNRVNVRAQPSLSGEVITQLQKGEEVVVLEEITHTKPEQNEPARWFRIQLPGNTPVWVFAPYIDPADKTVKATRLNLRAGPGENFSVVGRIDRGSKVNEIRRVEDWIEIEAPESAYAFVAADLLTKADAASPPTVVKQAPPVSPPQLEQTPPPAVRADPPVAAVVPEPAAPVLQPAPEAAAPKPAPDVLPPADLPRVAARPQKASSELPTRIVRREGIVRSTVSIQAPTYYELLNPDNRRTMNFLHAEKTGFKLKDYLGRRIVVTGQEAIDPRWPRTPVIEAETLEVTSHVR